MGLRSPFGNGPTNLSQPVPGAGLPTPPPPSQGPGMRGPAGAPAPQAQAQPAAAPPSGMSSDEVAALNNFNKMSPDEVAALHATDDTDKMLVGGNNGVADGLHKFMQENFGAIRQNKAGDKEIRLGSSWKKLSDGEWEALKTVGNVAAETAKMGGMMGGGAVGAGAMLASAPETAGASAAAVPAATAAGAGLGYDMGSQLVRMAKSALGIEDEDKRSEMLQHTMNFATGVMGAVGGEAGSATAQRFLTQQAGQYVGEQAGKGATDAAVSAGAQVAAERAQSKTNLANDVGVPLSSDQVQGQPAPNFPKTDDVNQMNAFRENQRAQIISKMDAIRTKIGPRLSEEEASNRSGLELVKGEIDRHEAQVSPLIKKAITGDSTTQGPASKAREAAGDRQFNIDTPLGSMKQELSRFGVNFDKEGNVVGSIPQGENGLGVMASKYQNLLNDTKASAGGFKEEGHLIATKEEPFGSKFDQRPAGTSVQDPLAKQGEGEHWIGQGQAGTLSGPSSAIPQIDMVKNPATPGVSLGDQVRTDEGIQPGLSGSRTGMTSSSVMPPNPAGKASRGVTLKAIDSFTRDAQQFANLDKSDRSPVEKSWGKIQHEFRIVRDDSAATALQERGQLGDAHALRNARNEYSTNIAGLQDLQSQLEKDPTNFGAALVHENDPVKTAANLQVINKMNPDLVKTVRGGWLDSIVDPNIDKANNVVGANAIGKRLDKVDPKVLRMMMGDEGSSQLKKLVNLAKIVENTPNSVQKPSDLPAFGEFVRLAVNPKRAWFEGGDLLSRLFVKQPGARAYIENNVKGYTFAPTSVNKVARPIPAPMGQR